jgi:uncharacterized protein YbgA (DUF1722 family)
MARDPAAYRSLGRRVARMRRGELSELAEELVLLLRRSPPGPRRGNALEHMWGHVAGSASAEERRSARASPAALLEAVRELALRTRERYLLASTALGELAGLGDGA